MPRPFPRFRVVRTPAMHGTLRNASRTRILRVTLRYALADVVILVHKRRTETTASDDVSTHTRPVVPARFLPSLGVVVVVSAISRR